MTRRPTLCRPRHRLRPAAFVALALLPALGFASTGGDAAGGDAAGAAIADSYETRERMSRIGMWTLGGWAVANGVVSGIMYFTGPGDRAFHEMNVMWNTVNLGLAASALISGINAEPPASLAEEIRAQHRLEKTLLINAGLDVGYVMAGFFLRQYAETSGEPRYSGWGTSLVLQGSFLFAFDVVLAVLQSRNRAYEAALTTAE